MRVVTAVEPKPGRASSEDVVGHGGGYYWLLDGATPPSTDRGSELTQQFLRSATVHLTQQALQGPPRHPQELLAAVIYAVCADFSAPAADEYFPHATAVLFRFDGSSQLEYVVLGDSYLVVHSDAGSHVITDDRLARVAVDEREYVRQLRREGMDERSLEYRAARDRLIECERGAKNRTGGFWVLSRDPTAAVHGIRGSVEVRGPTVAMAASDGFARLATHFAETEDLVALSGSTLTAGADTLLSQLRNLEHRGTFSREVSSAHDDAAFVTVQANVIPSLRA